MTVTLKRDAIAAPVAPPAVEQQPPFSGFEPVPWAKYTNSAFVADFDGKWIRVEAEFVGTTSVSPQGFPAYARAQEIATQADVFFTVRPSGGTSADDFAGVFIAKDMSDPLFTMAVGQKLILYGLGKRLVVEEKSPPAMKSEYTLLRVVQLEQVTGEEPVARVAIAPEPSPRAAPGSRAAPVTESPPSTPSEPRAPLILFGSTPEPGEEGVGGLERTVALSLGTGPLPLNTLTLGLTGLGARVMFPKGKVVPFGGLALNSGKATQTYISEAPTSTSSDTSTSTSSPASSTTSTTYLDGATSVALSGGVRFDAGARLKGTAVPYGLVAGMLSRASVRNEGDPEESVDKTGVTVAGLMAGLGMDGFVTSHLSLGAEFGGALFTGSGKVDYDDPDILDDEHGEGFASAYTALQMTVWR